MLNFTFMKSFKIVALLFAALVTAGSVTGYAFPVQTAVTENPAGPIIDQFLAMLNGTEATATAAVKKYCTQEIIDNKMIPFGKNPKILKKDGDCVIVALDNDGDKYEYEICEKDGKIVVFEMYFGEEED